MDLSTPDQAPQTTAALPPELVHCLEKNRFLHLATCAANVPHVALMNYTYLASSPYAPAGRPLIVMTASPDSRKMDNLAANPAVSLLVHDWILPSPPDPPRRLSGGAAPADVEGAGRPSNSLAPLLFGLNTSAVASISATMGGTARLVARGTAEERFYRSAHLAHSGLDPVDAAPDGDGYAKGAARPYVAGEDKRVVLVEIQNVRIADLKGGVRDWAVGLPHERVQQQHERVNGTGCHVCHVST